MISAVLMISSCRRDEAWKHAAAQIQPSAVRAHMEFLAETCLRDASQAPAAITPPLATSHLNSTHSGWTRALTAVGFSPFPLSGSSPQMDN